MRKTKIVCTIGPASEDPAVFREMCLSGLNVARLNLSHGTHEEHQKKIDMIKAVREELDLPIAIMLDTKGPEYRIGTFRDGKITLTDGADFTFTTRDIPGDEHIVSVSYKGLTEDLAPGDRVLYLKGKEDGYVTDMRLQGMEKLAADKKLQLRVENGEFSETRAYEIVKNLKEPYDAIVCASDLMAIGVKRALPRGSKVKVSGFDGIRLMQYVANDVVTCQQDFYEIGSLTVEAAERLRRGEKGEKMH